jgi:SAM-dependent methyltransferase
VHLELVARWAGKPFGRLLKTDLFEEANGSDQLLFELAGDCGLAIGLDQDQAIVERAGRRRPRRRPVSCLAADARSIPLKTGCIDVVLSNSTLDHFEEKSHFGQAVQELARILSPRGVLILTLDNPLNPLYWPLRWFSAAGPFRLGYTPHPGTLKHQLERAGLEVIGSESLLHNPRVISTLLFLAIRRLAGRRGDRVVRTLLEAFAQLGRLPTQRFTCCFYAVAARKRGVDSGQAFP